MAGLGYVNRSNLQSSRNIKALNNKKNERRIENTPKSKDISALDLMNYIKRIELRLEVCENELKDFKNEKNSSHILQTPPSPSGEISSIQVEAESHPNLTDFDIAEDNNTPDKNNNEKLPLSSMMFLDELKARLQRRKNKS